MNKKWTEYKILDVEQYLLFSLPENEKGNYKLKKLFRKQERILVFSKKAFKNYRENNNAIVVGSIRKRQRNYNDYIDYEELVKAKKKKQIIGCADLDIDKGVKKYDIRESRNKFIYGYAYVGENKFIEVTRMNFLVLLIPLLLALLLIGVLHFCPNNENPPIPPIDIVDGNDINDTTQPTTLKQLPNCDYLLFSETTTLTKDNPSIRLCNLKSNEGLYLISYEIYIDNVKLVDLNNPEKTYSTGAIKAGQQIDGSIDNNLNLYERLNAGTYELKCVGTQYLEETNEKGEHLVTPVKNTLKTKLIIEK